MRSICRDLIMRPWFFLAVLALALGACSQETGGDIRHGVAGPVEEIPHQSFDFSYEARIPSPPGTQVLEIWIPLPLEEPGVQELADLDTGGAEVTVDPVYGNRMIHRRVTHPKGTIVLTWRAKITRFEDRGQGIGKPLPEYLLGNTLIPIDGEARERAVSIGATRRDEPIATRARLVYDDVLGSMSYNKKIPGYGRGDFMRAMDVCMGNCTDFHARFIGTNRAAGIPSRFTMGIPLKEGTHSYDSYHCWAHWYDGEHWRPVDISEADKDPSKAEFFFGHLDDRRIAMTHGRDIILSPRQAGEPLNYFVFPYAEADGKPLSLKKGENWIFRW